MAGTKSMMYACSDVWYDWFSLHFVSAAAMYDGEDDVEGYTKQRKWCDYKLNIN